ncbi:hypothetical protein [Christiangramia echinicola]|uniref:Uncharacterized protein n=1 Tax=Christiangramia echinicola TaxID=279359 RepID=A0A1H1LD91_9FLAO|nr:hypothetical protein [Christiangramia echinicola]SDR71995.1 hypothetical protein SAMN04488552_0694 [Christiangramia echinicola]
MNFLKNISDNLKFKFYWKFPDVRLATVILDQEENQAYGRVKNGYAILESLPLPKTGYHYKDIVKVSKTDKVQLYREDKIQEFKSQKVYRRSNTPTFVFALKLAEYQDYFLLQETFREFEHKILIPNFKADKIGQWTITYCSSNNLTQVKAILKKFTSSNNNCKVKNLEIV